MRAGSLRDRLIIERPAQIGVDQANHPIVQWVEHLTCSAAVTWGAGDEQHAAAQRYEKQSITVTIRWAPRGIDVTDRLIFDGAAWNILSVRPAGRRRREALELRCERVT